MKKTLIIILSLSLVVMAENPKVAVGAIGEQPDGSNALKGLSTQLTKAIVKNGRYTHVDRSEHILKELGKEHNYQNSGAVDNTQIKELGKQYGVQYMCIVEISKVMGEYMLAAKLVNVETAVTEGMGSDSSSLKDMKELMRVAEELAKQLLDNGASSLSQPPVADSISDLQSGTDDDINMERRYSVNFTTEPTGAVLYFIGMPAANCAKTPCRTELAEGDVRIIAKLDQYETADTTVSIEQNNQNVSIRLKANFGVLEIKPTYSEGIIGGVLTDSRDDKKYRTAKIGNQTWMAENLNYDANGSKCYDNKPENCTMYGRLYNWATAKSVCPSGWHLPSKGEYETLDKYVGGQNVAGKKLKAKSGWNRRSFFSGGNGTDEFGFSALPGGNGDSDGSFFNVGYNGNWWSTSEDEDYSYAYYRNLYYKDDNAYWAEYGNKSYLFSVRCIQDSGGVSGGKTELGGMRVNNTVSQILRNRNPIDSIRNYVKDSLSRYYGSGDGIRSNQEIMQVVNARMSGLRNIYNNYLKFKPGFGGKVVLKFTIAPGGDIISISIVSSTTGYAEFDNAVKNMVGTWKWKAIKGGNTTPTIPFNFTE